MTWQQERGGGWQWQQYGTSSSNGGGTAECNSAQHRSCKPGDQATGASGLARPAKQWRWSVQKKCRHSGIKISYASALSTTRVQSVVWNDDQATNRSTRHRSCATTATSLCGKLSVWSALTGRCISVWRGHAADQTVGTTTHSSLDMGVQPLEASRKTVGTATQVSSDRNSE